MIDTSAVFVFVNCFKLNLLYPQINHWKNRCLVELEFANHAYRQVIIN